MRASATPIPAEAPVITVTGRRRARREDALADEIAATGERRPMVIAADLLKAGAGRLIGEALATQSAEPQFFVNNAGFGLVGPGEGARSR